MAWTEDRVELLKKLWAEGLSASQIANRLGGCTRNAVISKVHRLGLPGRVTTSSDPRRRAAVGRGDRPAQPPAAAVESKEPLAEAGVECAPPEPAAAPNRPHSPAPPDSIEEPVIMPSQRLSIVELKERMCRWPIGEPGYADFHFCGRDSPPGVPYCDHHARIAYQPAQPSRRRGRGAAGQ